MFRWLRRFSVLALLVSCAIPASVSASGGPAPTADYRFLNSLQSSVEGAPALTDLGAGGLNKFKKETVTKGKQWVYTFPKDNGVQLAPTTGLVANDVYTIVVQFRFERLDGFRRIADFKNGTQDTGLYDNYGNLQLYPYPLGGGGLQPNVYAQVVLTRDANGLFTGYVNGVQQLQVDDSTYQYGVIDTNNVLRFFRDNDSGGVTGEDSAGAVARIELFNSALSAAEVAALPTAPPKPTLKLNPKSGPSNGSVDVTGHNFGQIGRAHV